MKFWMCYVEGTSGCKVRHNSEGEAREEAERLARLKENIGKNVYVLETTSVCHTDTLPVAWEGWLE